MFDFFATSSRKPSPFVYVATLERSGEASIETDNAAGFTDTVLEPRTRAAGMLLRCFRAMDTHGSLLLSPDMKCLILTVEASSNKHG